MVYNVTYQCPTQPEEGVNFGALGYEIVISQAATHCSTLFRLLCVPNQTHPLLELPISLFASSAFAYEFGASPVGCVIAAISVGSTWITTGEKSLMRDMTISPLVTSSILTPAAAVLGWWNS